MGKFVVVIDDSLTVRKIMEVSLKREGFEVVSFPDGIQALDALNRGEISVPDLILLDVGLPRMDGYQVARLLKHKASFSQTSIIMLSGRDGLLDKIKGRLVGATAYITKPFKPSEVIAAVRDQLGEEPSLTSTRSMHHSSQ